MTQLDRAAARLRRVGRQIAAERKRKGGWPKQGPKKRSGVIKQLTVSHDGVRILAAARALYAMTYAETVDASLKLWARSNKLDAELARHVRESIYPGEREEERQRREREFEKSDVSS